MKRAAAPPRAGQQQRSGDYETSWVDLSGVVASLVVVLLLVIHQVTGRLRVCLGNDSSEQQGGAGLAPAVGLIRSLSTLSGV